MFQKFTSQIYNSPVPSFAASDQNWQDSKHTCTYIHTSYFFAVLLLGLYHYMYHTRIALGIAFPVVIKECEPKCTLYFDLV